MITALVGVPGSGKSYEAVVYHVLPALKSGRKVITNLPLKIEEFAKIDPSFCDLIDIRDGDAFRSSEVFLTTCQWQNPQGGGGPLYVVDEVHRFWPSRGLRKGEDVALRGVSEWIAEHRHATADIVFITQHPTKVMRDIVTNVELFIIVRNNRNLGFSKSYRRFTGDDFASAKKGRYQVRTYKTECFALYQSYTRGGTREQAPSDIKPVWRHWVVYLGVIWLVGVGWMVLTGRFRPLAAITGPVTSVQAAAGQGAAASVPVIASSAVAPAASAGGGASVAGGAAALAVAGPWRVVGLISGRPVLSYLGRSLSAAELVRYQVFVSASAAPGCWDVVAVGVQSAPACLSPGR